MEKFDSFDAVLDFAIEREIEANQFYLDMALRVNDPAMKKTFENFAKEELGHKAKLEAIKKGEIAESTTTEKPVDLKIADYLVDVVPGPDMSYQDILILAMKKEKAAFRLYTDLAEEVRNQAQRELFLTLAQEEARHKLRFELEYDQKVLKEN